MSWTFYKDILVDTDNTKDIASSGVRIKDIYIAGNISDGTNALTVANAKTAFDHVTADGSSHSFIDQSVVSGASPTFNGANITGVASSVIANEATDVTCFPVFVNTATGTRALLSNAGLTFNSNTGDLVSTLIAGIANANLVDKSAAEAIAGIWTHNANIVMADNSITGIDTLTFTDVNGTIAGIENQNLVDKSTTETIAGVWTHSDNILFPDNKGIIFGTGSDIIMESQFANQLNIEPGANLDLIIRIGSTTLTGGSDPILRFIHNSGDGLFEWDGDQDRFLFRDSAIWNAPATIAVGVGTVATTKVNVGGNSGDASLIGVSGNAVLNTSSTGTVHTGVGINTQVNFQPTGTKGTAIGFQGIVRATGSSLTLSTSDMIGAEFRCNVSGTWDDNTIDDWIGGNWVILPAGDGNTYDTVMGAQFTVTEQGTNSTITNLIGISITAMGSAGAGNTVTNCFGIYINDITGITSNTVLDVMHILAQDGTQKAATKGNIRFLGDGFDEGHLQLNTGHIWANTGAVAIASSAPTSDTDYDLLIESTGLTIGNDGDADYTLTFRANSNSGVVTWKEDEDHFLFSDDIALADAEFLIFDKASGNGIKVDAVTPTFGWRDLLGDQFAKNTGGTKPTLATYNGDVDAWQFSDGDEAYLTFHIPHDYVKGTDIHLHIHWSQTSTSATGGTIDFKYFAIYAKGHNQAAGSTFTSTPITASFSSIDINDGGAGLTQYQHHLTEVIISAASATAALFDRDDLEPDGVIELTLEMDTNSLTNSVTVLDPFIHYADIHYQSTNIATKEKAPDFYA